MVNSEHRRQRINRLRCQGKKKFQVRTSVQLLSLKRVAIVNVSPDFTAPVFRFEEHRKNRRELQVVEREVQ